MSLCQSTTDLYHHGLDPVMLITGGLYAPTIRYHHGTFYIACTNVVRPGNTFQNFVISTTNIWQSAWSDPVCFDFHGIDPSILFDDDGKTYIHGSGNPGPFTTIKLFEIDLHTGKRLGPEEVIIWEGTGAVYPEGPHLYKRDGWYYLLIAEGGTHENHMVAGARARNVRGPYEPCPANPLLTARGTDEYIQYTGHADIFQDGEGHWWAVCLGVRKDTQGRFIMGRESFLTPAKWEGDWISLERIKSNPSGCSRPEGATALYAAPSVDFVYIRDAELARYALSGNGTELTMKAGGTDLSHPNDSPSFVGKRQRVLQGKSSVTLKEPLPDMPVRAGIACYKDEHRFARIYYDAGSGTVVAELINNAQKVTLSSKSQKIEAVGPVVFRIDYSEEAYRLSYLAGRTTDGATWEALLTLDTLALTDPDFVGPVIGVFAVTDGNDVSIEFVDIAIE